MFSNFIKILFVISAYSPILLIVGIVEIINNTKEGYSISLIESWKEIFNRINFIFCFLILFPLSAFIMIWAENSLTKNRIEIKAIKSADFNLPTFIISYFLPCIELVKKDSTYMIVWCVILAIIIFINLKTYFYNPCLKLFGYRYYEISTKKDVTFVIISKEKLINANQVKSYSQLTDYVIIKN
jgi:hypothetical protein